MLPGMHGSSTKKMIGVLSTTLGLIPSNPPISVSLFDERYVRATITTKGRYGVVDDWKRGYSVLNADPAAFLHEDMARIPRNFPH